MFHSQLILDHAQHTAARVRRLRLAGGASVKSRIERWESRDVTQKLKPPEVGKATQSLLRSRTQRGNPYIRKDEQTGNAKRQQEDIIVQQFKARRRKSTVPSVLSLGFSTSESSEEGEEDRLTAITTPSVSSFCSLEVEVGIWDGQCDIEVIEAPHCPLPAPLITAARVWDELPRIKVPEAPSRPPPPLPDTQTCEKKLKIRIPDAPRRHPPPPPITTFQDWNEELTYKVPKAPRRPPPPPPILSPEIDIRTVWEVLELAKDSADMRAVIDERDDELEAQSMLLFLLLG